jgi:D-glycero-alpha-D-manno-heptose-7-phosphate kinase
MFLIAETASLRDALAQLDANHHGIILTTNAAGKATGLATDGDVRRMLLDGGSLDDRIASCVNTDFVWADSSTPRELLLKQLDHRIQVIPMLDPSGKLVGIVSRDYLPVQTEEPIYARARSPVRGRWSLRIPSDIPARSGCVRQASRPSARPA